MAKNCPEFHRLELALMRKTLSETERRILQEHSRQCDECRSQWTAHVEMLRFTGELKVPSLSSGFKHGLRGRLLEEQNSRTQLSRPASLVLSVYWLVAGLVSTLIIVRMDWPEPLRSPWIPGALLLMIGAAVLIEFLPVRQLKKMAVLVRLIENPASMPRLEP